MAGPSRGGAGAGRAALPAAGGAGGTPEPGQGVGGAGRSVGGRGEMRERREWGGTGRGGLGRGERRGSLLTAGGASRRGLD